MGWTEPSPGWQGTSGRMRRKGSICGHGAEPQRWAGSVVLPSDGHPGPGPVGRLWEGRSGQVGRPAWAPSKVVAARCPS